MEYFKYLGPILTFIAAFIATYSAFIRWYVSYKQSISDNRYNNYVKLVKTIFGGKDSKDEIIPYSVQIASLWLLLEYKEYYLISLKIFRHESVGRLPQNAPESCIRWQQEVATEINVIICEIEHQLKNKDVQKIQKIRPNNET